MCAGLPTLSSRTSLFAPPARAGRGLPATVLLLAQAVFGLSSRDYSRAITQYEARIV